MTYKDKKKQSSYQSEWVRQRREKWLLENGPCKKCGSSLDLELDHVDPNSKISHRVWSWSALRRDAELVKCQVLCKQCHLSKTEEERVEVWFAHGTSTTYTKRKCRCDLCRDWKRQDNKRNVKYKSRKCT